MRYMNTSLITALVVLLAVTGALAGPGLHGPDMPTAILMTGDAEYLGVSGPYRALITSDGRHSQDLGGPLTQKFGFDGQTAWDRDWNQTPRPLHLKEYDQSVLEGLLLSGGWADEGNTHDRFKLGAATTDSTGNSVIPFTMGEKGLHGNITVSQSGRDILSYTFGTDEMTVMTLTNYQDFNGLRWPTQMSQLSPDGSVLLININSVETVSDAEKVAETLVPQLAFADDSHFDNDLPAKVEIIKSPTGHLLVHPLIDGQDVGWFIFDTGAGASVLDNSVATELGYTGFGEITAKGVGGEVPSTFYRGQTLQLGRLTMDAPAYIGLELGFLEGVMGVKVAGVLGYGMISRSVVEFDATEPAISMMDPATYELAAGQWTGLVLYERHPCVPGKFEGHEGLFRLDTGDGSTVSFHYPTVERLELLKNRRLKDDRFGGVGGSVKAKAGVLQTMELGGEKFTHVDAKFAIEATGVFNEAYIDGNVGNELLKPFKLVFDYRNMRMAFVKK